MSLEEIPDDFEEEIGKFTLENFRIVSGSLIDTQNLGFPTLHEVLQSAFLSVSSGLLTIGAICSAVFITKGSYAFFDSHCHGHNGLSATEGASSVITFSSLDDLITYMYAFYDSMKLDTNLQFDFLPINVKKVYNKQSCKDKMESHMEAYFIDQGLRQANKTESEVRSISNDLSSISVANSKRALGAKKRSFEIALSISKPTKEDVDDTQLSKQKKENQGKLQEGILFLGPKKQCIRRNQSNLQEKTMSFKQKKENQSNQQEKTLPLKQKKETSKQSARRNPFLWPEKQCIRRNQSNLQEKTLSFKQQKEHQSNLQKGILFLWPKKVCIRRNQSNLQDKTLSLKQKKEHQSNLQEGILFLWPKKECIRRNQSNLQEKTMSLKQKKRIKAVF